MTDLIENLVAALSALAITFVAGRGVSTAWRTSKDGRRR